LRVESANFESSAGTGGIGQAMRIAVTKQDGAERNEVIYLNSKEQQRVKKIAEELRLCVGSDHRIALSALTKLTWELLDRKNEQQ
jgi:predicted dinucleotide-binding enzyme